MPDEPGDDDDEPGDDDDDSPVPDPIEAVVMTLSSSQLNSWDVLEVTVFAQRESGVLDEVTSEADIESSDPAVLHFYHSGEGQPLGAGEVEILASYGGFETVGTVTVELSVAEAGDITINEVLADGSLDSDPNGDGVLDAQEDEFVEIANAADVSLDLSGVRLVEEDWPFVPRHVFDEGTVLLPGATIVIFGGGDPSGLDASNVEFAIAETADSGISYGLALHDSADSVQLLNPQGDVLAEIMWGPVENGNIQETVSDESLVLSPEVYGSEYVPHGELSKDGSSASPGRLSDGSAFPGPDGLFGAESP